MPGQPYWRKPCSTGRQHYRIVAWVGAGGALDASKYLENLAGDVYVVQQVAHEWFEKNQVPIDVFAQPLCLFPLPDRVEAVSDSEELNAVRSCFDKITLAW